MKVVIRYYCQVENQLPYEELKKYIDDELAKELNELQFKIDNLSKDAESLLI